MKNVIKCLILLKYVSKNCKLEWSVIIRTFIYLREPLEFHLSKIFPMGDTRLIILYHGHLNQTIKNCIKHEYRLRGIPGQAIQNNANLHGINSDFGYIWKLSCVWLPYTLCDI